MSWSPSSPSPVGSSGGRRILREQTAGSTGESFLDSEVVPSSLVEITPILRVANKVEAMNPRIAYLCRMYAHEKAHRMDPTSSGRGVRQFKTVLLQRLERDNHPTLKGMVHETDALEMERFYREYYKKFIRAPQNDADNKAGRALLTESYQIAASLFEVLKFVMVSERAEVDIEVLHAHHKVQENKRLYEAYNILPFDPECTDQFIMRIPEIQAAVYALRDVRGLPWPNGHEKNNDLLDWLQATFGFQKDNVSNQREHMILLLANVQIRQMPRHEQQQQLDDRALNTILRRLFKNYKKWCKYHHRKSSLWLPTVQKEVQQRKLLYMGLYLLIWGEAANLRFMPECLCYIFHHMAFELYSVLAGNVSPVTGESIKPAYGGDEEAFLRGVVTPIYKVIEKEAERSKTIGSKHSNWRNYDDLNEYFWSVDCFWLGWPMHADADFFNNPGDVYRNHLNENRSASSIWMGKVNFVELRSFWHVLHSFDRMWIFLVLSLQAMIIIAWNGGSASDIFDVGILKQVLSIFITAAVLKLGQAILDIVFVWKTRSSMSSTVKLRYVMKLVSAATWAVILPVTYVHIWKNQPSLYILANTIYLTPSLLGAMLFPFPLLKRFLENSDFKVLTVVMWWFQPRVFVGRGMHESAVSLFKYTMFWVLLLAVKFTVNFYVEIKPLVLVTKNIIGADRTRKWHEIFLHANNNNIGVVIALWAPIILVYFMDTQIWYAIFSTFIGGIYGAFQGLGMIREFGMFRSYFQSIPRAFNECLIPSDGKKVNGFQDPTNIKDHVKFAARFSQMWNEIISSFRDEDLIDNREKELLLLPYFQDQELDIFQWPPFLLANKIPIALDMVANSGGKDRDLMKRIRRDPYMSYAIRECYALFRNIILFLVIGQFDKLIIEDIFTVVDQHIYDETLVKDLNMMKLPNLTRKFVELLELLLSNKGEDHGRVVLLFQDMLEVVTTDILEEQLNLRTTSTDQLFTTGIMFPVEGSDKWFEKIKRLLLLLTTKESAMDVPSNLEARRRLLFFTNSLFMGIPCAPKVQNMLPFCVLTHYHNEDVLLSLRDIEEQNIDGVSILFYLQKICPDEWKNFLERVGACNEEELHEVEELEEELCLWASYRASTLTRTIRGMMYYRNALVLQAYLDMATHEDLTDRDYRNREQMLYRYQQIEAIADMKFTYVVSCQQYGACKRSGDQCAHDILGLMARYSSIRVAYIDEIEECSIERNSTQKVYYSTLVKACVTKPYDEPYDQVIYKIKLPGNTVLGEVKSENQNNAIIFTRGECLQTIGVNQEYYMEEALKMRNLLQEFLCKHDGVRYPSILGVREHIFTGSVSPLAWFISVHESSYVTIGQRVLANPLRVRFHYGNSDIFDRIFHLTRGGVSKASKHINLSEDIFGGFNSTLRGGHVSHHEYMQIGKGRNAHFDQISLLEAKIANGNGEQTMSRDIHRLGHYFDFFRMFSCYYTTIGFYFSAMITIWTVYVFLYGRLYLVLSGCDDTLASGISVHNRPLQAALASESFVQLGFLMVLPMIMETGLERGFRTACSDFIIMQLQLASVFFTFSLGTKSHYYIKALLHGANEFRATGRGFLGYRGKFAYTYRLYARSHFVKGIELLFLLVVCEMFGHSDRGAIPYLITVSVWFMVGSWLFAPFLFNPSGFEWQNIVDDWADWNKWIKFHGGIGIAPEKSWESWWEKEQLHLCYSGRYGIIVEILLALRFFIYQFGLVYHWSQIKHAQCVVVYACSWAIFFVIFLAMKTVSVSRRRFSAKFQLAFRLIKGLITIIPVLVISIRIPHITAADIFVCVLSLMPAGWGMLLIAQAVKPIVCRLGFWGSTRALARRYDMSMGILLFAPVAFLAWFPVVSEFQTRILFNQAFNRGLQIYRILGKHKKG